MGFLGSISFPLCHLWTGLHCPALHPFQIAVESISMHSGEIHGGSVHEKLNIKSLRFLFK